VVVWGELRKGFGLSIEGGGVEGSEKKKQQLF
jgi:hypothetical protein